MKHLLKLFLLLVISACTYSQSLTEEMLGILYHIRQNIPPDQLFLHIDRNLYHCGDTIRFQAYIRNGRSGSFETGSISLYVLLLNSEHVTLDSARFRIVISTASGWLKVPVNIPPGYYSILAFTSNDMNYSPEYTFTTPIRIDDLVPYVTETKTGSKQSFIDKDPSLRQAVLPRSPTDLRFLPEGGTFIYGIKQRLAFNAVTLSGRPVDAAGVIINQRGDEIIEFRSTKYGPGVVEFTPAEGDFYFATLNGEEFKGFKWQLPVPEHAGVAMRVNNAGRRSIEVILNARGNGCINGLLTMTMNNSLVFTQEISLDTTLRKVIQTDKLPSGTAFITLYDNELKPLAERLILVNEYKKMNITVEVSSASVKCGEETELTLNTTDYLGNNISSLFSVAVIDSASGNYAGCPVPEIESAWLYDRDFYNNLPSRIRSLGLKNMDSASIDILLLTYGWRKFTPKEVTGSDTVTEPVNYDLIKITNPGPEKKGRSDIKLIAVEGLRSFSLLMDERREATLYFESLDLFVRQLMIVPDKNRASNDNPVRIIFPENNSFTSKAKLSAQETGYVSPDLQATGNMHNDHLLDKIIVLAPVTVTATKNPSETSSDKNAEMFRYTGASTMYSRDFVSASSFEDILYRNNQCEIYKQATQTSDYIEKCVYLRNANYGIHSTLSEQGSITDKTNKTPALIVVDNNPVGTSYESIADMPASHIASVTFLRGMQGFARYGYKANGGVVFVTTKKGYNFTGEIIKRDKRDDDLLKQVRLFRTDIEYYIPTREEVTYVPEFQHRPTVLWLNNLYTDGSGPVKIRYFNNLSKGTAMVFVNGISFTNLFGSKSCSYRVR